MHILQLVAYQPAGENASRIVVGGEAREPGFAIVSQCNRADILLISDIQHLLHPTVSVARVAGKGGSRSGSQSGNEAVFGSRETGAQTPLVIKLCLLEFLSRHIEPVEETRAGAVVLVVAGVCTLKIKPGVVKRPGKSGNIEIRIRQDFLAASLFEIENVEIGFRLRIGSMGACGESGDCVTAAVRKRKRTDR